MYEFDFVSLIVGYTLGILFAIAIAASAKSDQNERPDDELPY